MAACPQTFEECTDRLDKFLHGSRIGIFREFFRIIERNIQVRRLNIVLGFLACLGLFFLASDGAHFLCNFIGFVYPACVIIWTVEQRYLQLNSKKWLTYCVIYHTFSFLEYFLLFESSYWRLFSLLKCITLSLCFLPAPWNGSESMYHQYIHPFLQSHQHAINTYLLWAWESTSKGIPPFVVLYCAYMWGFQFLCNILGFIYPAYISQLDLLMNEPEMDKLCWLTYWIVYSGCGLLEYVFSGIPLFYPLKFVMLGVYFLEPLAQTSLYDLGQRLILQYKPMKSANRLCHNIVHFFLKSHQTSQGIRVNQRNRVSQHGPSLSNMTPKKIKNTVAKEQAAVDPLEVNLYLLSSVAQAVLDMDVEVQQLKKAIELKLARDGPGQNFASAEDMLQAVFDLAVNNEDDEDGSSVDKMIGQDEDDDRLSIPHSYNFDGEDNPIPEKVIEENRLLKDQRLCKICMTEEVEMVFVPCGHLVCCYQCSRVMTICPICRMEIENYIRAYMS